MLEAHANRAGHCLGSSVWTRTPDLLLCVGNDFEGWCRPWLLWEGVVVLVRGLVLVVLLIVLVVVLVVLVVRSVLVVVDSRRGGRDRRCHRVCRRRCGGPGRLCGYPAVFEGVVLGSRGWSGLCNISRVCMVSKRFTIWLHHWLSRVCQPSVFRR